MALASAPLTEPGDETPLAALLSLLEALERARVAHCHFKSNEHLGAALCGATDLDLLVARSDAREAQAVFAGQGFKRFDPGFGTGYPGVEDWIGFDPASGRQIHLHVHFRLPVGELHLKSYRLPFAEALLGSRVHDAETGVFVAEPHHELLLLLVRRALKLTRRERLLTRLGRGGVLGGDARREYDWLRERTQGAGVVGLAEQEFGKDVASVVAPLLDSVPDRRGMVQLRKALLRVLSPHRTWGAFESALRQLVRGSVQRVTRALRRRGARLPRAFRRSNPSGGCVIAFVGCDGAGKSTLLGELGPWLGWKLDVLPIYFGSGDGPVSVARLPLVWVRRLQKRLSPTRPPAERSRVLKPRRLSPARAIWALVLAFEKSQRLATAERARQRGIVVLCDRFPQTNVRGFNDGPLLTPWLESPQAWRRRLAGWELGIYESARRLAPDLVIKLDVSPEVAVARKPDMAVEECARRRAAVASLEWGERCHMLTIDAEQPLERVIAEAKAAIWAEL
jgi:thymidylate kinase